MTAKKTTPSKKTKKIVPEKVTVEKHADPKSVMAQRFNMAKQRMQLFLARRPHRSFKRTLRRDYVRSLKLPGYWAFTNHVRKTLWLHKNTFILLALIYGTLTVLLVGMASQDTYTQLSQTLRNTSSDIFKGNWGAIGQASLLLATGVSGDFGASLSQAQQICAVIIVLITWLTTVWLLRAMLAGQKPKLRDGLYNAGSPIISTFMVALLAVIQLIPIIVVILGFAALVPFGVLDGGAESMLFWGVALLLIALSVYWLTSTFIALVVVTLPGMYPMQAIKTAGDLVIGRRIRVLLRMLWLLFITALAWVIIVVPIILFDTWLKSVLPKIAWLPIVPSVLLVMGTLTSIWAASYIYLLYRRIVDDDAAPA